MPARDDNHSSADAVFRITGSAELRRPAGPWAASLGFHVVLVGLLTLGGSSRLRSPEIIEGAELFAEREHEIVWHTFREELPATAPPRESPASKADGKAEYRAPQTIVADDPDPRSDQQMVWSPEPAPEIQQDIPSPNLLVWTPPKVARPRFELKAPKTTIPEKEALRAPKAPKVEATPLASLDLQVIQPMEPLRYQSFHRPVEKPRPEALDPSPAPEIEVDAPLLGSASDLALQEIDPLRYWTEPDEIAVPEPKALAGGAAPQVSGEARSGLNLRQIQPLDALRYQTYPEVAGGPVTQALDAGGIPQPADLLPRSAANESSAVATAVLRGALGGLPEAPASVAERVQPGSQEDTREAGGRGTGSPARADVTLEGRQLAVVGVNPSSNTNARLPSGRRKGRFSAAPDGGPGGEGLSGGGNRESDVRIPNLAIGGSSPAAGSSLAALARRLPRSVENTAFRRESFLAELRERTQAAALRGELEVEPTPKNPEAVFLGRRVYTMAVNMPNINSRQGSWVVRFSEVGKPSGEGELLAPAPRLKVDPAYSRVAMEEKVEGEVILSGVIRGDGAVVHIELIKSLDERLDRAALAAFSKWRFDPALKNGVPVDVEVVVRVPFSLRPLDPERFVR